MNYPTPLVQLIESLKKLPGVGSKSAERFAFHLLTWDARHLSELSRLVEELPSKIQACPDCGCLQGDRGCRFCAPERAALRSLCVIASPRDVYSIEGTHEFKGLYHVLGGVIAPLSGIGPEKLTINKLLHRIQTHDIQEVVIALDSTLEGDATALHLKKELSTLPVQIFRLAFGIPMGSSIDYVDGGTLARAFLGRSRF